ncbi:MAG: MATE family efflux transporter [Bacteroidales bacterium]
MRDMTVGTAGSQIFRFALPMLLGNVFQQMYNIVDTIILGQYIGKNAVAAAGASFPVIFVLLSLVIGIATGTTIIISQYYGAKDFKQVKRAIDTAFVFLFFASIVLTVIGLIFIKQIWVLIGLPDELIADATLYFNIFAAGFVFLFGYNSISSILRGLGDSKTPLYFLIIASILNVGFDLLFVLVFNMGIGGVAFATVLAQGIAFILSVLYLNKTHVLIKIKIKELVFDKDIFFRSVKIGLPTGMQHTFVALGMIAMVGIVSDFGTNTLAAFTIAGRIDMFAAMPAMNFGLALSTFVGQNIGANKLHRIKAGLKYTLTVTSIISIVVSIAAWLFGEQMISIFNNDPEVIRIGYEYLIIVVSFYIIFSAMFVTQGVLRGAGDTIIPMFITLLSLWVFRLPASYLLSQFMGTKGIWLGIPIAWMFGFLAIFIYYRMGRWKKKSVIKSQKPVESPDAIP